MWRLEIEFNWISPGSRLAQITEEAARINDIARPATEATEKKRLRTTAAAVLTTQRRKITVSDQR